MGAAVALQAGSAVIGAASQYSAGQNQSTIAGLNASTVRNTADTNLAMAQQTAADNAAIIKANLAVSSAEAKAIEEQGAAASNSKRIEVRRLLAYQHVQEAVSGFRYEGTPIDVAEQSLKEGNEDVATIWKNAATNANLTREKARNNARVAYLQNAQIVQSATNNSNSLNAQANIYEQSGSYAKSAGTAGSMSTLLSGLSQAYTMYNKPTNTKIG